MRLRERTRQSRVAKVAPEPERVEFNPELSLLDAVKSLTSEEASTPRTVAGVVALQLLDQLMRSSKPTTEFFSDRMMEDLTYIQAQAFTEKPDLKQVFSRAVTVADGIEFRTCSDEGSGIRRLHEIERALMQRKLGKDEPDTELAGQNSHGGTSECTTP